MSGDNPLINSTDLWNDVIYSDVETQLVAQGYEVDTIQALFSDTGASMGDHQAQINQIVDDGREGYAIIESVDDSGEQGRVGPR